MTTPNPTAAEFAAALKTAELHADDTESHLHTNIRRSAENTAEETMTKERCHASRDGECNWKQCPQRRDNEPMRSGRHCPIDNWDDEDEDPAPAPAQTPEPVEPSEEELKRKLRDLYESTRGGVNTSLLAVYRAGLAAEAAAHARYVDQLLARIAKGNELRQASDAELERVRAELEGKTRFAAMQRQYLDNVAIALDLVECGYQPERLPDAISTLRAQARARRVPSRDECAAEFVRGWRGRAWPGDIDVHERELILHGLDAVLRLFAEAPPVELGEDARDAAWSASLKRHTTAGGLILPRSNEASFIDGWDAARAAMTALGFQDSGGEGDADSHGAVIKNGEPSAQPSPLVTSDNEPPRLRETCLVCGWCRTPPCTCKCPQRAAEPTPEAKFTPTVGERAVLVSCGRWDHQRSHQGVEWTVLKVDEADSRYRYHCQRDDGFHVWFPPESTWRPASAAPAKAEPLLNVRQWLEGQGSAKLAEPPEPPDGGVLGGLTARVAELELQFRVDRRLLAWCATLPNGQEVVDVRNRFEREERERQSNKP